jgi:hypothetical protein
MQRVEFVRFPRRHFGVELEVGPEIGRRKLVSYIKQVSSLGTLMPYRNGCWMQSLNNDNWHVKYDCSCGLGDMDDPDGYGWEVTSFKAKGYHDLTHICRVADNLQRHGVSVNENCGLHVHVDISDFAPAQVGILLANWIKIEPIMFRVADSHRANSSYCMRLRYKINCDRQYRPFDFWDAMRPKNLEPFENGDKERAVNLVNYARTMKDKDFDRPTVEFRFPEGTLDGETIKNWVQLFVRFVDVCKTHTMPTNLKAVYVKRTLEILGLRHRRKFYILSRNMNRAKIWFLKRLLRSKVTKLLANEILENCEA